MDYILLGGDARMAALARLLRREGFDARRTDDPMEAAALLPRAKRVIVNCPPKLDMDMEAILALADERAVIFLCGPESRFGDGRLVNLWLDEALLLDNARLTAEGAVASAMRAGRRSIREQRCAVIGWGRIGRALTEMLVALGAATVVASRDIGHRHRAIERGAEAIALEDLPRVLPETTLIFSTAPAMVLDGETLRRVNREAMLIDLASPPYGVDLHAAWSLGLRAWREPGLPGRYCPESAAKALMEAVRRGEERV